MIKFPGISQNFSSDSSELETYQNMLLGFANSNLQPVIILLAILYITSVLCFLPLGHEMDRLNSDSLKGLRMD